MGWLTAALAALVSFGGKAGILLKILLAGKALTLISALGSFGIYALAWGPWFGAGLVLMLFVHEMGHVLEIRRQGMRATAPVFIPFLGAAIFQRSHPTDALKQAQIGIAGPITGTLGATAALVLYSATGINHFLFWAGIGFFINLINLIPVGMLDGGWILAPVSKWFQLAGVGVLLVAARVLGISPFFIVFVLLIGAPAILERFRNDRLPYYRSVPIGARVAIGAAWVGLVAYLAFFLLQVQSLAGTALR